MGILLNKDFKKDLFLLISNTYLAFLEDNSPVKSGNLKRSWILVEIEPLVYLITNEAEYAKFLDEGTGIYGPKKKLIVPTNKKALKFKIGGTTIFVKSIKGIKPLHMILKAKMSKKLEVDFAEGLAKLFEKYIFTNK